jgi:DNA mismatch repair protein MutS
VRRMVLQPLRTDVAAARGALGDELPLLKRDGGFVRVRASSRRSTRLRALRDDSRRVIAGAAGALRRRNRLKTLKIKHNNVLGYFVEVPQAMPARTDAGALEGDLHPSPDHGGRHALHDDGTRRARSQDRQRRRPGAEDRARSLRRLSATVVELEAIAAAALALAVVDVTAALATLAERTALLPPEVDIASPCHRGRPPPGRRAGPASARVQPFIANACDLSPGGEGGGIWLITGPTWAVSRPSCARTP